MRSDISMNAIKTRHARDELLRYCPVWVSGDINFDLGAQIGEKSEEHAEAPVWYAAQKNLVVFVRERIMVNNDKCDILTDFGLRCDI
jgi:hypothetical protein